MELFTFINDIIKNKAQSPILQPNPPLPCSNVIFSCSFREKLDKVTGWRIRLRNPGTVTVYQEGNFLHFGAVFGKNIAK